MTKRVSGEAASLAPRRLIVKAVPRIARFPHLCQRNLVIAKRCGGTLCLTKERRPTRGWLCLSLFELEAPHYRNYCPPQPATCPAQKVCRYKRPETTQAKKPTISEISGLTPCLSNCPAAQLQVHPPAFLHSASADVILEVLLRGYPLPLENRLDLSKTTSGFDVVLLVFGFDSASANLKAFKHLANLVENSGLERLIIHGEPCAMHQVHIVKARCVDVAGTAAMLIRARNCCVPVHA